jgi:hypothetical protein
MRDRKEPIEMLIPNLTDAEGVVLHWLRAAFNTEAGCTPDAICHAAADALDNVEDGPSRHDLDASFGAGAEFGVRIALAVVNAPLGGAQYEIKDAAYKAVDQLKIYAADREADREMLERQATTAA